MPFDIKEESEFIQACWNGNEPLVRELLIKDPSLANKPSNNGIYPLMFVAEDGNVGLVNTLLEFNACIDAIVKVENEFKGMTALLSAANGERWEVVKLLIDKGARDLDAFINREGQKITTLWHATTSKQWDLVTLLIGKGANLDILLGGITVVWMCAAFKQWSIVKLMLEQGAGNLDVRSERDTEHEIAVLHLVFEDAQDDIFRILLNKGVSLELSDSAFIHLGYLKKIALNLDTPKNYYLNCTLDAAIILFKMANKEIEFNINLLKKVLQELCASELYPALNGRFNGQTALDAALAKGNIEVIGELMINGANLFDGPALCFSLPVIVEAFMELKALGVDISKNLNMRQNNLESKEHAENWVKIVERKDRILKLSRTLAPLHKNILYYKLGNLLEAAYPKVSKTMIIDVYSMISTESKKTYQKAFVRLLHYKNKRHLCESEDLTKGLDEDTRDVSAEQLALELQSKDNVNPRLLSQLLIQNVLGEKEQVVSNIPHVLPEDLLLAACTKTLGFLRKEINKYNTNPLQHQSQLNGIFKKDFVRKGFSFFVKVIFSSWNLLKFLLKNSIRKPYVGFIDHATPALWEAAILLQWNKVRSIIIKDPSNLDFSPSLGINRGITVMYIAANHGQWDIVACLLEKGARNLDACPIEDIYRGVTIFWMGAANRQWDIVRLLLKKGIKNVDTCPSEGKYRGTSVLWLAANWGQWDVVKVLLEKGAKNLDVTPLGSQKTVLYFAIENGQDEILRILLNKGVSLALLNNTIVNVPSLIVASGCERPGTSYYIQDILKAADTLFKLANGDFPLDFRLLKKILQELCYVKAFPALNGRYNGKTALDVALAQANMPVIEQLMINGADVLQIKDPKTSPRIVQTFMHLKELRNDLMQIKVIAPQSLDSKEYNEKWIQLIERKNYILKLSRNLQPQHKNMARYKLGKVLETGLSYIPTSMITEVYSNISIESPKLYQKASAKLLHYKLISYQPANDSSISSDIDTLKAEAEKLALALQAGNKADPRLMAHVLIQSILGEKERALSPLGLVKPEDPLPVIFTKVFTFVREEINARKVRVSTKSVF